MSKYGAKILRETLTWGGCQAPATPSFPKTQGKFCVEAEKKLFSDCVLHIERHVLVDDIVKNAQLEKREESPAVFLAVRTVDKGKCLSMYYVEN